MNRLREFREKIGVRQRDLAQASGVSQATISRYESGEGDISAEYLGKLCQALNISADYVFEVTDDPRPYREGTLVTEDQWALITLWERGDVIAILRMLVEKHGKR